MKVLKLIVVLLITMAALVLSACQQAAPTAPAPAKADKPAAQAEKPAAPAAKPAEQPAKPAEAAKPAAPAAKPAAAAEKPAAKAEPAKAPAKLSKITVATIPIAYMVPAYAARDKGFFAAEGLEVAFQDLAGGAAMIPAMEAGQFQFGESAVVPPILAKEQGLDIKMVLGNTRTPLKAPDDQPIMIKSDSPIANLKGLEGKKVAINTLYTTNWALLRESMRRQGGDPNKIQWVEIPFPNMPDALLNNQVDAVIAVEPSATLLLKTGKAKVLANYMVDALPGLDNAVWIVSGKWAKDHQEETKAFVRAMTKGIEFVNGNTDEKNRLITTFIKLPPEIIKDMMIPPYEAKINVAQMQKLADLLTQENVLKKQMNIKDIIWEGTPTQ